MRKELILILVITFAAMTRLPFLDILPNGFSGDETQQGYSAYSILKTGRDEWGEALPLFPRGFGDFKPPLYTYLTIPLVAIFGLNEFAVRLPAAILGILTIVTVYFLVKEWFQDEKVALFSSFLLAISPWHTQLSRTAFEGGVGVFFFILGLLFFLKGLKDPRLLVLSALFWGLTLYSYHSYRLFTIIFILGLLFLTRFNLKNVKNILALGIFLILLLPIIMNFQQTLKRASDVGIFSPQVIQSYFENKGTSLLPYPMDRLLDNKVLFLSNKIFTNYLSYYSPTFFFTGERPDDSYLNFPFFPLIYPVEIIFWIIAGYVIVFKKEKDYKILLLWFFLAAIPASLSQGSMSAHRAVTFLPAISVISGIGASSFLHFLRAKMRFHSKLILLVTTISIIFSLILFLHFYLFKLPIKLQESLRLGYKQVFQKIVMVESEYDQIIISRAFTQPQIFVAFYGRVDPNFFQQASQDWLRYEKSQKLYIDQLESWNLGKFLFEDINWKDKDSKRKNALIVARAEDFPVSVYSVFDVKNQRGDVIFKLVPSIQ